MTAASRKLGLAQPTISGQLAQLESAFGKRLFEKSGRNLVLTEFGRMVAGYANEIFSTGNELIAAATQGTTDRPAPLLVGVADVVPKLITALLLEPVFDMKDPEVKISVVEGKTDALLADLAIHRLDLVISDGPIGKNVGVRAFNHELGRSHCGLFATPNLARKLRKKFPDSLGGLPFVMPSEGTVLRRDLDDWLQRISPPVRVTTECDDAALIKVFGQRGRGIFPSPMAIADRVEVQYQVKLVGEVPEVTQSYFGISLERRLTHPAIQVIQKAAREKLA